jgi:TonB family protein
MFLPGSHDPEEPEASSFNYVIFVRPHVAEEKIRKEQESMKNKGNPHTEKKTESNKILSKGKVPSSEKASERLPGADADGPEEAPDKRAYLRYLDVIRENIRSALHEEGYIPNKGEAVIKFTVSPEGDLLNISSINAESSEMSAHIDRAMRNASPFPSFPEGFGRKPLTFSITVKVL